MNSYRSESDNRSRREEENAAASENAKWTQRNDNFAISASNSNRELAQSAQSDSPYTPNQSSTSTSVSQPPSGPVKLSPAEAKRVAQTHFRALQLWLKDHSSNAGSTRSGARAKLEKLTRSQSAELSTDVFDEMVRRQGEAAGNSSAEPYLPVRNEFHPKRNQARQKLATLPLQRFSDLAGDVFFDLGRRYPDFMDVEATSPTSVPGLSSRSAPSHLPVNAASALRRTPTPTGAANSASNDIVVPNKSTIVMEESPSSGYGRSARGEISPPTSSSNSTPNDRSGGYSGSLQNSTSDSKGRTSDDMPRGGRVSETSSIGTRFMANYSGSTSDGGRASWENDELQKIKSDYEYKITVMSKRITDLERENEDSRDALHARSNDANRARELESQVQTHRDRFETQSSTLQKLATDYEALQSTHSRFLSSNESTSRLRQDLENVSLERNELEELSNDLRAEVSNLVDELRAVNARYEELLEASEREGGERREIEEQTMIWRKKYEAAKTELRNIKATSQLFVGSTIKIEGDHLPASSDGVIADVHVSAFQTSIDDLLSLGRSKEPSSVLSAMHKVISAVNLIDQDVQSVDPRRISSLPLAEQERLSSLKSKTNATLSNLMTASRNHAVSFGVSPVSLLDAAASHLSAAVIDLVRILRIRRTTGSTANGREDRAPPMPTSTSTRSRPEQSGGRPSNERSYISPTESDRQAEENRYRRQPSPVQTPSHENRGYGATQQEVDPRDRYADPSPLAPTPVQKDSRSREQGYGGHLRGGSVLTYGSPDPSQSVDYSELKSYLENQTEAIVHSIQALLSAIRSGAQGAQLNENLTQIITIVSSIVAISKDALPRESRQEGEEILLDLTDNCRKLSEMQEQASEAGGGVFNKQTKQSLASSSFGVAKSLKSLNALLK